MKKCLIGLLVMILSIIPMSNVKADFNINLKNGENVVLPDKPDDGHNVFYIFKSNKLGTYHLFAIDTNEIADRVMIFSMYGDTFNIGFTYSGTTNIPNTARVNQYVYDNKTFTWEFLRESSCTGNCYFLDIDGTNKKYTASQLLYSNVDVYTNNYKITVNSIDTNLNIGTYEPKTLIYSADKLVVDNISYEYEIKQSEDNNFSYYDIRIFSENYNSNYSYYVRFDDEPFRNITSYLSDIEGINYEIPYNTDMTLWVRDEFGETVESKTMTFTELIDIEQYDSPTLDINIVCSTNLDNIENAKINVSFNNYSTNYKYQYSFNNIDFIDIPYDEIKNKSYTITTYLNTSVFLRIIDNNNNVVFEKNDVVKCIREDKDNKTYTYELSLNDLYDKENHKLIFYSFYYENNNFSSNRDFKPYVYFFYTGSEKLDFHITYNTNAISMPNYREYLMNKTLSDLPCTSLPFEYVDDTIFNNNYTSYTVFSFMPCIDLSTFLYNDQYQDFKLIVKSNIELKIGEPIDFAGNFIPSTNKPLDDSNNFQSNYKTFFEIFNNSFNRFKGVVIEIFQNCTYVFDSISPIIQDFFITIFVIILFIFLIRFIL